jgi:hypothetical protein
MNVTEAAMTDNPISEQEARAIAEANARRIYRDLSIYRVDAKLIDGDWHVDYELPDPATMVGGGPHYVISAETGEIKAFRYEQ